MRVSALKVWLVLAASLLAMSVAGPVVGDGDDDDDGPGRDRSPIGTWQLSIEFPGDPTIPPFAEFITIHRGGTLTETNTTLHANSANEFFPFNGSAGQGLWKRGRHGSVDFRFRKFVFDGFTNQITGLLQVTGSFRAENGEWIDLGANTVLLDLNGNVLQDFGQSASSGFKLEL